MTALLIGRTLELDPMPWRAARWWNPPCDALVRAAAREFANMAGRAGAEPRHWVFVHEHVPRVDESVPGGVIGSDLRLVRLMTSVAALGHRVSLYARRESGDERTAARVARLNQMGLDVKLHDGRRPTAFERWLVGTRLVNGQVVSPPTRVDVVVFFLFFWSTLCAPVAEFAATVREHAPAAHLVVLSDDVHGARAAAMVAAQARVDAMLGVRERHPAPAPLAAWTVADTSPARLAALERDLYLTADLVVSISAHDRRRMQAALALRGDDSARTRDALPAPAPAPAPLPPPPPVVVLPLSLPQCEHAKLSPGFDARSARVLFVGPANSESNALGARWLVLILWPRVRALVHDAELRVIGSSMPALFGGAPPPVGVTLLDFTPGLDLELARARVLAVPWFTDSGASTKAASAQAAGLPVVFFDRPDGELDTQAYQLARMLSDPVAWADESRAARNATTLAASAHAQAVVQLVAALDTLPNVRRPVPSACVALDASELD